MNSWKIVSKKIVFENQYRPVEEWIYEKPDGTLFDLTMVQGKDVVIVAAVTPDKKFLVIQDFFPNVLKKFPSLVAGMVEEGESPESTAVRELKEEAGCVTNNLVFLGSSLAGKYFNFTIHYFLAWDVERVSVQSLEEGEDIDVTFLDQPSFEQLVHSTTLQCVFDLACSYRALDYLKKQA